MPASPVTIFTPPGAGATPTAPGAIYEPAPVGKAVLAITGVATAGVNGSLIYAGLNDAKAAWSSDGTLTAGASNTICKSDAGVWSLSRGSAYAATKTSGAATPDGLTTWTVTTGTGSPTLAAASVAAAAVVFTPPSAGAAPEAPGVVFTPPSAGNAVPASLTTAFGNPHSNMVITARTAGAVGNNIAFRTLVGGINRPLSVVVVGDLIQVSLQTDGSAVPTGLASAIRAAINANLVAGPRVSVEFAAGNDGSGVALQMTTTSLSGGAPGSLAPPVAVFGT